MEIGGFIPPPPPKKMHLNKDPHKIQAVPFSFPIWRSLNHFFRVASPPQNGPKELPGGFSFLINHLAGEFPTMT